MALQIFLEEIVRGNCASIDDGVKVLRLISPEMIKGFTVEADFKGINFILTPFLNACFGKIWQRNNNDSCEH